MPSYQSWLLSREYVAKDTLAIHLAKPLGFRFHAGQYADVVLADASVHDLWGNLRTFSMACAPFEADLEFVVRVSTTAFKRALSTAPPGTAIELKGPGGDFHLHCDIRRPAVFLVGGVGIAPFLSMVRQARHDHAGHEFYLFYSNRHADDAAYLDELRRFVPDPALRFHLIPTITGGAELAWDGEKGRIDARMLQRYVPSDVHPVYYVAGLSQFVSGMISALTAVGAGEADVRIEDFGEF